MIYFTSDLHLGHENVIRFADRPFQNVSDMNRSLIANYNALVRDDDTVYILGDLTYKVNVEEADRLISKLNGRKILIKGNHDRKYDESLFEKILIYDELSEYGGHFVLMHYPMLEWKRSHHGSIQLHGHIHSRGMEYNLECKKNGVRRYDVGVDANGYYPVALTTILDFMNMP